MSSLPSSSELPVNPGLAYERLHPRVRAWIWDQGWDELRQTQVKAIGPIMDGDTDVIISAATASGKTEAAWLPVSSVLGFDAETNRSLPGVKALYVSPLKALINDQYGRLSDLGSCLDLPVYRRHGDVGGADRRVLLSRPDGILLITPESLEALFVHYGTRMPTILNGLRYLVIDELHAFIGSERGAQLQSLLHRVELAIRRRVPRIALSATLADHDAAAAFLRPGEGASVTVVGDPSDDRSELRMQLRGYLVSEPPVIADGIEDAEPVEPGELDDTFDTRSIAGHLFTTLRGTDNLVFANARRTVETYADILTQLSDDERVPNEFFPHHGNLSKEFREDVERRLKSPESHATAICTSTLELGIDIGSADSIAQIGAPGSVTALRQRLGRSGRRGQPATLRLYVSEDALHERTSPVDQLRTETIQTIATIELLLEKWYEPPNTGGLHLSTLIQQVLSVIAQHGGATAPQLFSALCADGPFAHVTQPMFVRLLRDLGNHDLITQASDGTLLPGGVGERLINHYTFYTAFLTAEEYRLVADGNTLGSIPVDYPIVSGTLLVFAGRRWKVIAVDTHARVIDLVPSRGGRPPNFTGGGAEIADVIRRRMRSLLEGREIPAYVDATGQRFLDEARSNYQRLRLDMTPIVHWGRDTIVFPWRGDRVMNTLAVLLVSQGLDVGQEGVAITCRDTTPQRLLSAVTRLATSPMPEAISLARDVKIKAKDKHDRFLGEELLTASYAARDLDVPGVWATLRQTLDAVAQSSNAGRDDG